jgi:hypothetical protein
MAYEPLPSTGPGSATVGFVARASWGEQVRLDFEDHEDRLQDVEAAVAGVWRGAWEPDTTYNAGDIVQHDGGSWRASESIPAQSPDVEPGTTSPDPWVLIAAGGSVSGLVRTIGITIDGAGGEISTGVKGYVRVPFAGTITKWTLLSTDDIGSPVPQTGSIEIDVWKTTFASYPPTDSDSITASAPPTLTSAQADEDETLTGWDLDVDEGDVFGFNVVSVTDLIRVTLILEIEQA